MSDDFQLARKFLLSADSLTENKLLSSLKKAMGAGVDFADIFMQYSVEESWYLEDGVVKKSNYSVDQGFGLRAVSGDRSGFAYSSDLSLDALNYAANSAKSIASLGGDGKIIVPTEKKVPRLYLNDNPLISIDDNQKVKLLHNLDKKIKAKDPKIKDVFLSLSAEYDVVLLCGSDGIIATDVRPMVQLQIRVLAEQNGRRETGRSGGGARDDYGYFTPERLDGFVDKAVHQALINLEARPAPAGEMPVVLGPGWPGVLLHEAVGHGLEGDFNRKGSSIFSGRVGEQIANKLCTIVDDGTLRNRRGSLSVDDEGVAGQYTTLVENGVLCGYMQDKLNAKLMGVSSTGNGRRESYTDLPLPRMTNTYMLPGESEPEEIISSLERGLYAVDFSGGQVDITSGQFVFTASEAYWVENGKVQYPVKGATLIGSGPNVLPLISMVGNDLALDSGIGVCGKAGQSVPVGVGQPTIKIEKLTVGGAK